jgi:hypothetical protein
MPLLLLILCFIAGAAFAQQAPPPPGLEPVPDGPPEVQEGGMPEPEVTIRRRAEGIIREYRVNGRLYMVQVIPKKGIPYFLVDTNGDGNLESRFNDLDSRIMIPAWVILSW